MGWLRDLMATSDPPVPSFGRLATAALAHPQWPADTRPQARSLATLFSKLDREQDLDWLADRVEVQRVLAELLRRPVADVQQALPQRRPTASGRLVRLDDLRYGRELDLAQERLCPGIPERLLEPTSWGCLSWVAPSGAGRSLAGAWLEARGRAKHVVLAGPLGEADEFPPTGPLLVEIPDVDGAPSPAQWTDWAARLGAPRRPVCLAMPYPATAPGWDVLHSPSPEDFLPELVAWVAERLPGDGHFEAERALAWMRRVALPSEAVVTLGDALGLLGMLDEVRPRTLHGRSLDEVAESFVRQRLVESSEETTVSSWLSRNAFAALLGTIAQLITESDRPWNQPRTFDEWLGLVPEEYREGIDVEWMRAALSREAPSRLRSGDLALAARKLPPGGYQLLRALEHARILTRSGEHLRLRPHWLGTTLEARAAHELLSRSPSGWAEALLRRAHAPRVVRALFDRVQRADFAPIYAAVEFSDPESPASVAAIEASAAVLGIAAECGTHVPSDLVADVFAEQEHLALPLPESFPERRVGHDTTGGEPLLDPFAWRLGTFALAAQLGTSKALLDPFRHDRSERARTLLRDQVYPGFLQLLQESAGRARATGHPSSVRRAHVEVRLGIAAARYPWPLAVYSIVDALRASLGPLSETPTALELPSAAADALQLESGTHDQLLRLDELPWALPALVERVRVRGLEPSTFVRRLWQALDPARELPAFLDGARSEDVLVAELWRSVPTEWLKRRVALGRSVNWQNLLPHHFAALLNTGAALPSEVARFAPLDALLESIERRGLSLFAPAARTQLWQRSPQRMLQLFDRALDNRELDAMEDLLRCLPAELATRALPSLERRIDLTTLPLERLHLVRRWLAGLVAERVPDWQHAYALLHRVETALAPIRRQI